MIMLCYEGWIHLIKSNRRSACYDHVLHVQCHPVPCTKLKLPKSSNYNIALIFGRTNSTEISLYDNQHQIAIRTTPQWGSKAYCWWCATNWCLVTADDQVEVQQGEHLKKRCKYCSSVLGMKKGGSLSAWNNIFCHFFFCPGYLDVSVCPIMSLKP